MKQASKQLGYACLGTCVFRQTSLLASNNVSSKGTCGQVCNSGESYALLQLLASSRPARRGPPTRPQPELNQGPRFAARARARHESWISRGVGGAQRQKLDNGKVRLPQTAAAAAARVSPVLICVVLARAVSATPPSIAIAAPVLGGPEIVRVVFHRSSSSACRASGPYPSFVPLCVPRLCGSKRTAPRSRAGDGVGFRTSCAVGLPSHPDHATGAQHV